MGFFRLRFSDLDMEARYKVFEQRLLLPFYRAGLLAASSAWAAAIPFFLYQYPESRGSLVPIAAALAIIPAALLWGTYVSRRLIRALPFWIAFVNSVAGLCIVYFRAAVIYNDVVAVSAVTILIFFAAVIFRLPVRYTIACTAVYLIAFDIYIFLGPYGFFDKVSITFIILMAEGSALFGCFVLERSARDLFLQQRIIRAQERDLRMERARSDDLLHSILPVPIADRLKSGEEMIVEDFEETTILFADIVGFTSIAERLRPAELLSMLNDTFRAFDEISERRGLEKIKTIGDAYMAVAGVPERRPDHARRAVDAARDMLAWTASYKGPAGIVLRLRIGLHSGPVTAGVVGKSKYSYDLWGDTVNTAARMESHGEPGRVQITERTRALLPADYGCESRGTVAVKGKGEMALYLLI